LNKRTNIRYIHTYHSFNHSLFFHSYGIVYSIDYCIYSYKTNSDSSIYHGSVSYISGKESKQLGGALSAVEMMAVLVEMAAQAALAEMAALAVVAALAEMAAQAALAASEMAAIRLSANLAFLAVVGWMAVANRKTASVVGEAKAGMLLLAEAKALHTEYD
jgi:hypothetical protein